MMQAEAIKRPLELLMTAKNRRNLKKEGMDMRMAMTALEKWDWNKEIKKIPANVKVIGMVPGQIFDDNGEKIVYRRCWLLACEQSDATLKDEALEELEHYDEDSIDSFCLNCMSSSGVYYVPLVARGGGDFLRNRDELRLDADFLDRENWTFDLCDPITSSTTLVELLSDVMDAAQKGLDLEDLQRVFEVIQEYMERKGGHLLQNADSLGEEYPRHFYLALNPQPADDGEVLWLEYDDGSYLPETTRLIAAGKSSTLYHDVSNLSAVGKHLCGSYVEEIFEDVSEDERNVLSSGLEKYRTENLPLGINTQGNTPSAKERPSIFDMIYEVHIVPTIWRLPDKTLQMCYDFFGAWYETGDGAVKADFGHIVAEHLPGCKKVGLLGRRA